MQKNIWYYDIKEKLTLYRCVKKLYNNALGRVNLVFVNIQ